MIIFFNLLKSKDKQRALLDSCHSLNEETQSSDVFQVDSEALGKLPGTPFSYWVSNDVRNLFDRHSSFEAVDRSVRLGDHPGNSFRYLRLYWEIKEVSTKPVGWVNYQKGGKYSPFYADIHLVALWNHNRDSYQGFFGRPGRTSNRPSNFENFFRPGLTWPRRTAKGLGMRVLPRGCIFADKGPGVFVNTDGFQKLLALLAISVSTPFRYLVSLHMAAGSYEVGVIQRTPIPNISPQNEIILASKSREAWLLKVKLDTTDETSHAFILPDLIRSRFDSFDSSKICDDLDKIVDEIDKITFDLYGFESQDRLAAIDSIESIKSVNTEGGISAKTDHQSNSLNFISWCVGVAFGRFDWRLAIDERKPLFTMEPFEELPERSLGMIPGELEPFHGNSGILVDDPEHDDDLAALIGSVFECVSVPIDSNIRAELRNQFFPEHLKKYSKSRRSAPIYWPLQTPTGDYTLWLYYPSLNAQTLYRCVNDYIEPKLKTIEIELKYLRSDTIRNAQDETKLSELIDFQIELKDLSDGLMQVASYWRPNLDDGVQIMAAPLWKFFTNKQWQAKLKKTWEELEDGYYDWSHLAFDLWPDRILKKCHQDRSLAVAHDIESELWEEKEVIVGKAKKPKLVWQPKEMTESELNTYIQQKIAQG